MDTIERWISFAGPRRVALLEPLRARLQVEIEPPSNAAEMMAPLRSLVAMRDLPSPGDPRHIAIAEDWAERFGFDGDTSRGTGNIGEAEALVLHLAASELVRIEDKVVTPSPELRAAERRPAELWELVADTFLTRSYVFASQPELALAGMARRTIEGDIGRIYKDAVLEAMMIEDRPVSVDDVELIVGTACSFTATACRALRMIAPDAEGVAVATFTPGGLRLALRALRAAARSDQRYMWALEEAGVVARN